ncbi:hypothetical protein BKA69DRAFT_1124931 [Paraphysoderma sedebokerense]|nr:hypothetical protein BKA69DRAFT_1124931 [Paraphysoderma sedebokerense]
MTQELEPKVTVLYGSQTGNAESIARNIHEEAIAHGHTSDIYVLNDHEKVDFTTSKCLVFVTSTTGDGDAPDNANKFFRFLRKQKGSVNAFEGAKFTVLGLGDTNYSNFCNTAKRIQKRFLELGCTQFYECAFADDATGLEPTVDPWIAGLWDALPRVCMQNLNAITKGDSSVDIKDITKKLDQMKVLDDISKPAAVTPPTAGENLLTTPAQQQQLTSGASATAPPQVNSGQDTSELPYPPPTLTDTLQLIGLPPSSEIKTLTSLPRIPAPCLSVASTSEVKAFQMDTVKFYQSLNSSTTTSVNTGAANSIQLPQPISAQNPHFAKITGARTLTRPDAVKRTVEVVLDVSQTPESTQGSEMKEWEYRPGDAIGVLAPNNHNVTMEILKRLEGGVTSSLPLASQVVTLSPLPDQPVPVWISSHLSDRLNKEGKINLSLYEIFRYFIDVTTLPKKVMFRVLAEFTEDEEEKKKLLWLCSREGAKSYTALKESAPTLLTILTTFPNIRIPILGLSKLLSILMPLSPRYYSLTSTPLKDSNILSILFNVVVHNVPSPPTAASTSTSPATRHGIATPYIDALLSYPSFTASTADSFSPSQAMTAPPTDTYLPIFPYPAHFFHLPSSLDTPMILIGPGTGIAPFMGFLRHRAEQKKIAEKLQNGRGQGHGNVEVFFGCRHPEKDWLFKNEVEELVTFFNSGASERKANYHVSFSRYEKTDSSGEQKYTKYVTDEMKKHGKEVYKIVKELGGKVYLCGDAKSMQKTVLEALVDILVTYSGQSDDAAKQEKMDKMKALEYVTTTMKNEGRWLLDLWG